MSIKNAFESRREITLFKGGIYAVTVFFLLLILLPIIYILLSAIRPISEYFTPGIHWIPKTVTFDTTVTAFNDFLPYLINSFIIASGTALLTLLLTVPGAYVFARKDFPGQGAIFYLIVLSLLFPHVLLVIPISDMWRGIGLYNNFVGLWIGYQTFTAPLALWIFRDWFSNLPENLEEAAQVYGCTELSAIYRVILPLSAPAVVAVGFLAFHASWNDFLFSNVMTTGNGPRPAVVQLYVTTFTSEQIPWNWVLNESLIIGLPPVALYLVARGYLSEAFAL